MVCCTFYCRRRHWGSLSVEFVELLDKVAVQMRVMLERTAAEAELETQYQRVKETLFKLESTQMQLYQAEKLASVGQLAAGIAHEINNPITFLAGNMGPLEEYTAAMAEMLTMHQAFLDRLDETGGDLARVGELRQKADELDLAFVMEDVRSVVDESRQGLQRVTDIVRSLTRFARKDAVDVSEGSLEEGIEATLKILRGELGGGVHVLCEFAGVPPVVCNHALINQVFMNVLVNAAYALRGNGGGTIRITTGTCEVEEQGVPGVEITFADDGPGISDEVINRIFDPFFTTKPVGEGTGLGLSMCHDIVRKHDGTMRVQSKEGEGATFVIQLPLQWTGDVAEIDGAES